MLDQFVANIIIDANRQTSLDDLCFLNIDKFLFSVAEIDETIRNV